MFSSESVAGRPHSKSIISRPTKSFAVRAWAEDDNDSMNINEIQIELKHAHMQLLAERARVRDLQQEIKNVMENKYKSKSSIVSHLQQSQNRLREQLSLVIQSKMQLCESTAQEIERLRILVSMLVNKLESMDGNEPQIHVSLDYLRFNEMQMKMKNKMVEDDGNINRNVNIVHKMEYEKEEENAQENEDEADEDYEVMLQMTTDGNTSHSENGYLITNEIFQNNVSDVFPHNNRSRIDARTIHKGEEGLFPDPFAAVDLKYVGYKFNSKTGRWHRFTNNNISSTVFETRLGNHENIIGLEQAVLSMTRSEVARVWVPSRLGYGMHGAQPLIQPNTDLIFELTLVEIRNEFHATGTQV